MVDVATSAGTNLSMLSSTSARSSGERPKMAHITRARFCISTPCFARKKPQKACRRYSSRCSLSAPGSGGSGEVVALSALELLGPSPSLPSTAASLNVPEDRTRGTCGIKLCLLRNT
jgi:hypothetical protein